MIFLKNHHKDNLGLYIFIAVVAALIIFFFTGCYNERKANKQFHKVADNFPKIPVGYCADEFPVKDSTIRDTIITTDTIIYHEQDILTDTIFDKDTVRIIVTKTLPGKVITNTIHIKDTVFQTNTAALKLCEMDKSILTDLLKKQTGQTEKYKGMATKRGWIMWGLLALILAYIGLRTYLRTKKILK